MKKTMTPEQLLARAQTRLATLDAQHPNAEPGYIVSRYGYEVAYEVGGGGRRGAQVMALWEAARHEARGDASGARELRELAASFVDPHVYRSERMTYNRASERVAALRRLRSRIARTRAAHAAA